MVELSGTQAPVYSHTQKAPLCLILYGSALLLLLFRLDGRPALPTFSSPLPVWACSSPCLAPLFTT